MITREKQHTAERIARWSHYAYPLLLIAVLVYSFAV
ncbi:hypothetical protein UC8_52030 [Roseimaritima ulvae]|uniref:Uncharacterized protein n=1 Tax=Roseimaritima ulvae TaxID=980254 RepID=A0A5B9QVT8_9BACT|nr:hypothetical protein UC8_52030 [Roseimaritima ulvae]